MKYWVEIEPCGCVVDWIEDDGSMYPPGVDNDFVREAVIKGNRTALVDLTEGNYQMVCEKHKKPNEGKILVSLHQQGEGQGEKKKEDNMADTIGTGYVDKLKELNDNLRQSEKMLWERIQMGNHDSPMSALATVKALEHVTKAISIIEDNLSQLPLPLLNKSTGEIRA